MLLPKEVLEVSDSEASIRGKPVSLPDTARARIPSPLVPSSFSGPVGVITLHQVKSAFTTVRPYIDEGDQKIGFLSGINGVLGASSSESNDTG
jgi:hypothetical protein